MSWVLVVPHPNPLNQVHSVVLVVGVALAAVALAAGALAAVVEAAVAEVAEAAMAASVAMEEWAANAKLPLLIALECYPVRQLWQL